MFEAFRVGPVETSDGDFTLYMACSAAGAVSAIAPDDRAGLAELRKQAPAGAVTCEPGLAAAGAQLGFRAAALSDEAKLTRATFATMLHLGRVVEPRVMAQLPQTIEVAQRFLRARPWQLVRPEVPIELTIELGGRERRRVASVLGADGIEHGLALHEHADALARFVELVEDDRRDELQEMSFTSLTLDPGPAWVADAVTAAYGDPIVLVPVATGADGLRVVTSEDLTTLAAAMFAVSKLAPGRLTAEVTVEVEGGGRCRATARIADRDAVSAPPLPAWATRPVRMSGPVPAAVLTVPILPVADLAAAAAGLRALGFTVTESVDPPSATATWPGLAIELVHVPAAPGGCCHIIVEAIDPLVAAWKDLGVEVHVVEHGGERVAYVEVPGGLSLTFGTRLPAAYRPPAGPRRRSPRRRAS
jgi:hypothetical protein